MPRVMDASTKTLGFPAAEVMGGNFLPRGISGARVRNVRGGNPDQKMMCVVVT